MKIVFQMTKEMIPNLITATRLVGVVLLLFVKPLSTAFFVIYTLCGISDVVDGTVARAMKCTSEFGAKLDSISDLLFYLMMLIRVFPPLYDAIPKWIWLFVALVIAVRLVSYLFAAIKYHRFASVHTYLNKATGFVVFLLPYVLMTKAITPFSIFVCSVAMLASVEELIIHITNKEYSDSKKSMLF